MNANIHSFVIRARFFWTLGHSVGYATGRWYPASFNFCFSAARREFLTVTDHMPWFSSSTKILVSLLPFWWHAMPPALTTPLSSAESEEPCAPLNFSLWPKEFTPPVQFSKNAFFINTCILPQRRCYGQWLI